MSFTDKVVIVTGGSSGIGAATVIQFAKEGAKVVIVGRNEEKLKDVAKKCQELNADYHVFKGDISSENDTKNLINETINKFGKLDVLVNNAGILREGNILDGKLLKVYDEIMNTNLKAVVVLTSLAAPHLIKTKGSIVNVSSVAGESILAPNFSAYSTSKAGLNMFTRVTAAEMAPHGVRVNTVSPGPVRTNISKAAGMRQNIEDMQCMTTLGRVSDAEEIADLILYLTSEKAKGVTGSNYVCDNGTLLVKIWPD